MFKDKKNMTTFLVIGDTHFKTSNITEVEEFIDKSTKKASDLQPSYIILLGDILDTHEKINTIPLNYAYTFIDNMQNIAPTFVIVGNHDMCDNSQFLNNNHWLNGMKKWNNVTIVDRVLSITSNHQLFLLCPYVFNGRFIEALSTYEHDWRTSTAIFAHQEFRGCKMGAFLSTEGDEWDISNPNIISGHIHSNQSPQINIYYPGSSIQNAFGESEHNIIAFLTFNYTNTSYIKEEIDLLLPRKKIIYMNVEDLQDYIPVINNDKIKITLSGFYDEFKLIKKTEKYKELLNLGYKINFKPTKKQNNDIQDDNSVKETSFLDILKDLVIQENNIHLSYLHQQILNNN